MTYEPCGNEPLRIVPFSLDGLPLVPKPLNVAVDERFDPSPALKHTFKNAGFQHDLIVSKELPAEAAMRTYLRMACELEPFSFDYCQGQVWRHLQSVLFKCLSHTTLRAESISDIVQLHERMKRYSNGPPVDAFVCYTKITD